MIFYLKFLKILRNKHTELWNSFGNPTFIMNSSLRSNFLIYNFIRKKYYYNYDDPEFIHVGNIMRKIYRIYLIVFLMAILSFVLVMIRT